MVETDEQTIQRKPACSHIGHMVTTHTVCLSWQHVLCVWSTKTMDARGRWQSLECRNSARNRITVHTFFRAPSTTDTTSVDAASPLVLARSTLPRRFPRPRLAPPPCCWPSCHDASDDRHRLARTPSLEKATTASSQRAANTLGCCLSTTTSASAAADHATPTCCRTTTSPTQAAATSHAGPWAPSPGGATSPDGYPVPASHNAAAAGFPATAHVAPTDAA
jgi:hypothetical protein